MAFSKVRSIFRKPFWAEVDTDVSFRAVFRVLFDSMTAKSFHSLCSPSIVFLFNFNAILFMYLLRQ